LDQSDWAKMPPAELQRKNELCKQLCKQLKKICNAKSREKRPSSDLHGHSNSQEFSRIFCDPIIRHPVHNKPQLVPILCQNLNFHAAPFS